MRPLLPRWTQETFVSVLCVAQPSLDQKARACMSDSRIKSRALNKRREPEIMPKFPVRRWRVYCQIDDLMWYDPYAVIGHNSTHAMFLYLFFLLKFSKKKFSKMIHS